MIKQIYFKICFYSFLLLFAVGLWSVNILCICLSPFMGKENAKTYLSKIIHQLTHFYLFLLNQSGALVSNQSVLKNISCSRSGKIIIANHPSLLDAPLFVGTLPALCCVYKSALTQSLIHPKTAQVLGFLNNSMGFEMLKSMIEKLKAGETVLLFPEGTRSIGNTINPLNSGYALAAIRAKVPIQLVCIHSHTPLLSKKQHFLKSTTFPVSFLIDIGPQIEAEQFTQVKELNEFVEDWFREQLKNSEQKPRTYLPNSVEINQTDTLTTAQFNVPTTPFYCNGHMPNNPLVPAYVQLIWIREILSKQSSEPCNAFSYNQWKFLKPLFPLDSVLIKICKANEKLTVTIEKNEIITTKGKIIVSQ